jgi:hypothetical protein
MMKHIILEFAETPRQEDIDFSVIEYSHELNLNVFKGTKIPAVNFADQATQTDTKAYGDVTDSDRDLSHDTRLMAGTSTQTRVHSEVSDSDDRSQAAAMLDTSTQTFVHNETSDNDRELRDLVFLSATQTITERIEATDSDK